MSNDPQKDTSVVDPTFLQPSPSSHPLIDERYKQINPRPDTGTAPLIDNQHGWGK